MSAMKLILTQDVAHLGAPGDVVEVKAGYGRNYLVPQGLAILATRGAEKQVANIRRARQARNIRDLSHANEIKQALETLTVTLPARAGEGASSSVRSPRLPSPRPVARSSTSARWSSRPRSSRSDPKPSPSRCTATCR